MLATSAAFKENARRALADTGLQAALARTRPSFPARRAAAVAALPEFEQLRAIGRDIKNHTLANLDFYLETWADNVARAGGHVHWCATAEEARDAVLRICQAAGARTVTKGKSMLSEELGINDHLQKHDIVPVETDLGEYILQLRDEPPSHIIAPAFHLSRADWEDSFRKSHTDLPANRVFTERRDIMTEARTRLRNRFLAADVGITGANFLIAETGSSVIVTNEGCWRARPPGRRCRSTPLSPPAAAARATWTGRRNTMSCWSITAAPACWAPSSRTCCAASAVPPA
jgi:L-lactate dehydrogenase complex protein LldF